MRTIPDSSKGREHVNSNPRRTQAYRDALRERREMGREVIGAVRPENAARPRPRAANKVEPNTVTAPQNKSLMLVCGFIALANLGMAGLLAMDLTSHSSKSTAPDSLKSMRDAAKFIGHTGAAALFGAIAWKAASR